MNKKRPVNLDLTTMKFPITAIASILHRISGVILFILFPGCLYFLSAALKSEVSFERLMLRLEHPGYQFLLWVFSAALIYHALAGFRHLLMDIGLGEGLLAGRRSAIIVISATILLVGIIGVCIW